MSARASHERAYRALLRLYPEPFRQRFGAELVQLFGDVMRDAREGRGGRGSIAGTWSRLLLDVALTAPAEHLEQRRVAHTLTAGPSPWIRLLGLLGVAGGLVLVAVWLPILDVIPATFNLGRLFLFNLGAIAITAATLRRSSDATAGTTMRIAAVTALLANAWYLAMVVLSVGRPEYPEPDPAFRGVFLWAGVAMWWADAAFGLALLRRPGPARWGALALAIGSVGAFTGMGHLRLYDGELGWFFLPASQIGIALNGIGWMILGLAVATRRRPIVEPSITRPGG